MEDIVDTGTGRKLQPNDDLVDELDDAVRPEESWLELATDCLRKR
jgi:hypothetical protein